MLVVFEKTWGEGGWSEGGEAGVRWGKAPSEKILVSIIDGLHFQQHPVTQKKEGHGVSVYWGQA